MIVKAIILLSFLSSAFTLIVPSRLPPNNISLPLTNAERIRRSLPLKFPSRRAHGLSPRVSNMPAGPPITTTAIVAVSPGPGARKRQTTNYLSCGSGTGCTVGSLSSATQVTFTYTPGSTTPFGLFSSAHGFYIGADYRLGQSAAPGDIAPGSSNTLNLDGVGYWDPYTPSSDTTVQPESSIWSYDPLSGDLTPNWVNSNGNSPPTTFIVEEGTSSTAVCLTGDVGLSGGTAVTFQAIAPPTSISMSGYIAIYTDASNPATLQGYLTCTGSCYFYTGASPTIISFTYTPGIDTSFSIAAQPSPFYIGGDYSLGQSSTPGDIGPGSSNTLGLDAVSYSPPGSTSSNTVVWDESSIWTYDAVTSILTPHWINSDGSLPTTYVYKEGSPTLQHLRLTGDLSLTPGEGVTLVYSASTAIPPATTTLTGYISVQTNPADPTTRLGYLYCVEGGCLIISPTSTTPSHISFTQTPGDSTSFSIVGTTASGGTYYIGADNQASFSTANLALGSPNTVGMDVVQYSDPGTRASTAAFQSESSIWTYDAGTSVFTPHWVDSDGSMPATYVVYENNNPQLLTFLTGDVGASGLTAVSLVYTATLA